ncbi:Uncharacterised protein [Klebsiella grimontii]|uniref:Uncharacterized protein n=1 Tax=Klebsiella grimontii TaxID=2058152 RepID=A0A7H4P110_9ENTR|nr:Uncharacterised protein [Klebsiella grimontii]
MNVLARRWQATSLTLRSAVLFALVAALVVKRRWRILISRHASGDDSP